MSISLLLPAMPMPSGLGLLTPVFAGTPLGAQLAAVTPGIYTIFVPIDSAWTAFLEQQGVNVSNKATFAAQVGQIGGTGIVLFRILGHRFSPSDVSPRLSSLLRC